MSISRALFSGVTGLRNHALMMDIIANNIANVNTAGYKASRVTFEETFAMMVQGASRPPGTSGGVNPMQVGLGTSVGSIDVMHTQGTLESTGVVTDLAIEGDGFFIVSDGVNQFFTRSGAFQFDSIGNLVSPNNGLSVQGLLADSAGNIAVGTAIGDIRLPFGQKSPAKATTSVSFVGNLNAGQKPAGSKFRTKEIYAKELSGTTAAGSNSNIQNMLALNTTTNQATVLEGITENTTTVTVIDGVDRNNNGLIEDDDGRVFTYVAVNTASDYDFNSLQDLVDGINNVFGASGYDTLSGALDDDGVITFTRGANSTGRITIKSTNSNFQRSLQTANMEINVNSGITNEFSHIATSSDLLTNLRDSRGNDLGIQENDTIIIDGRIGGNPIVSNQTLTVAATSTVESFTSQIALAFDITTGSVSLDSDGKLVILGDGGTPNELTAINITASDGTNSRTYFEEIYDSTPNNYVEIQSAADVVGSVSSTVFDSLGQRHVMTLTFTKDAKVDNRWTWSATMKEPASVSGGSTGVITFKTDGSLASFIFDGAANSFQFEPKTGALNPVAMSLNVGTAGAFNGITQLGTDTSLVASDQDGFGLGELSNISIDNHGRIEGQFTNGRNLLLAQLSIADFNNESGLIRVGDNTYQQTTNSGVPIIGAAGTAIKSKIVPGALEQSNVDLAQEFTNMIVAQRGFQAAARVIPLETRY